MTTTPIKLSALKTACQSCNLHDLCLPLGLDIGDIDQLDKIIKRNRPLQKGEFLFNSGEHFTSIYAVRSGSIKTFTESEQGDEQITGLYLPGELMGLDAIHEEKHPCSAIALETTSLCEIPFDTLEELSSQIPELHRQLFRIMSKEIASDQSLLMLMAQKSAEERLAAFLVNLSTRLKARNFSGTEFNLSMSRKDIGNFLGLTIETISRTFSRFQSDGLLSTQRKYVNIHKLDTLKEMAGLSVNCNTTDCPASENKGQSLA
ncbi:Fumarate and nitrate reduction regulatory protein [hydrothermal vent metagenome]|uniref:Fumarate and nitrate reduction regulatory protein n=1 Tax=hydrothermal vent metagenome TaxID=652676 RepID=A0A3B0Y3T7_9ZZZZ